MCHGVVSGNSPGTLEAGARKFEGCGAVNKHVGVDVCVLRHLGRTLTAGSRGGFLVVHKKSWVEQFWYNPVLDRNKTVEPCKLLWPQCLQIRRANGKGEAWSGQLAELLGTGKRSRGDVY